MDATEYVPPLSHLKEETYPASKILYSSGAQMMDKFQLLGNAKCNLLPLELIRTDLTNLVRATFCYLSYKVCPKHL
jgi:hypothetical protein